MLFGGGRMKNGSASNAESSASSTRPERAQAPSRSKAAPRCRACQRSSSTLPGPVSNPRTSPRRGRSVRLAMPPMLTMTRCVSPRKSAAWKAGTRGAPWPPAATSRLRKSATTVTPARSAIRAALLSCSVQPSSGRWRSVWPWTPAATTSCGASTAPSSAAAIASAQVSASALAARAARASSSAPGRWSACNSSARLRGNGTCAAARSSQGRPLPGAKSATTASTPSRLVPDITPA